MKEHDNCHSNDSSKRSKGKSKKYSSSPKLYIQTYWPKVMISRNDRICKRTENPSGSTSLSFLEGSTSKLQPEEKATEADCDFYCDENRRNFEEEHDVCLISSSSEIQRHLEDTWSENGKGLKKIDGSVKENSLDYSMVENVVSDSDREEKPIFVDLTTDEKNTWKQNILKRFCDVNTLDRVNEEKDGNDNCSKIIVLEPQIMIADSSSKLSCNGGGSLATALRDRGPCLIPVQPNRSLPIRPAPIVPTRSFRKDCSSMLVSSKPSNLDVVEMESTKLMNMLSNDEIDKEKNIISEEQTSSKNSTSSLDYVVPQISSVGSLSGIKKNLDDDTDHEEDSVKENKKKRRSQEADSSQNKEERIGSSIKEFLKNFCVSSEGGAQNSCSDKCPRVVSTTDEERGGKLVPPLRLKKIVRSVFERVIGVGLRVDSLGRGFGGSPSPKIIDEFLPEVVYLKLILLGKAAEAENCSNSQVATGTDYELNYRIVTGTTPRPQASPIHNSWSNTLYEKDAALASLRTDSHKLKYRRNRLKQKLRELRGKAVELAKQMANDTISQQNTRLRQMMNRYEKQIENLSKLHRKLSANLSISDEVIDVNDDEYLYVNLNETSEESAKNNSPISSPEPPKLSPRSPENHENSLSEEVRNIPPTLSRVCLMVSSSQNPVDEDHQVSDREMWPINEDSMKPNSTNSLQYNSMDSSASPDLEESMGTTYETQKSDINVDIEESDLDLNKESLNSPKKVINFFENNQPVQEKKEEKDKPVEEFSPSRFMNRKVENVRCFEYSDSVPIISSVTSGLEPVADIQADETFESTSDGQLPLSQERVLKSNCCGFHPKDISFAKINESSRNVQRVTSTSSQLTQFDSIGTPSREKQFSFPQDYKDNKIPNDSVQRNSNSYPITEQFPTLGNWAARMSKKQTSKVKSKLQTKGSVSFAPVETATHISRPEMQKTPNPTNDITNATLKCSTDRWQYYNQQQQRQQQLLQHVAGSVNLSQPVPTVPPLRPGLCPPIPMSQFYSNNYAIDPCNGAALSYHPAIYPFGNYSYHSRLHPSPLPGYHFSMQESLRSLQHTDKHFPFMQEPRVKYPSSSTSNLHHSNNLDFDRVRGNLAGNNVGVTSCLPSLFLSPSPVPPPQQILPQAPLRGYSTSNQFSRNRMIPDVVAAAAAAAVVAAASFNRQRDTLACGGTDTTCATNVIDGETEASDSGKTVINRDLPNQTQNSCFGEENHEESTKYQKMQNFLYDRLAIKAADNFTQSNSVVDNVAHSAMTSAIASTIPYRMSSVPPQHTQLSKSTPVNEIRNCETPNLGKVSRSPNSLHNLACSNCGVFGPKFKCLGCETVFYCDERCQEKHWNVHVQWCPKKMPKLKKVT